MHGLIFFVITFCYQIDNMHIYGLLASVEQIEVFTWVSFKNFRYHTTECKFLY